MVRVPLQSHFDSVHRACSGAFQWAGALIGAASRASGSLWCGSCASGAAWRKRTLARAVGVAMSEFAASSDVLRTPGRFRKPADDPVLSTWRETQRDLETQPEDVDLTGSAKPHRIDEPIDGKAVYGEIDSDEEPLCLLLVHPRSPVRGRHTVLLVGWRRSLSRIWATPFSVPHRPVLSPCKSCLEALCSVCPICCLGGDDRLPTSHGRRPLRRLSRLLRRRGDCTSGPPPHTDGDFFGGEEIALHTPHPTSLGASTTEASLPTLSEDFVAATKSRIEELEALAKTIGKSRVLAKSAHLLELELGVLLSDEPGVEHLRGGTDRDRGEGEETHLARWGPRFLKT